MEWILIIIGSVIIMMIAIKAEEKRSDKAVIIRADRIKALSASITEGGRFTVSKHVDGFAASYFFAVDENIEQIAYATNWEKPLINFIDFIDIIGVELIENGNIVIKKSTARTIGGAIVGGVLAGGTGAIIGGLSGSSKQENNISSVYVKILLRSIENPSLTIECFHDWMNSRMIKTYKEKQEGADYIYNIGKANAVEIKDLISIIIDRTDNKNKSEIQPNTSLLSKSIADELLKLNELKEKGILTEDEFTLQKNKLLNQ